MYNNKLTPEQIAEATSKHIDDFRKRKTMNTMHPYFNKPKLCFLNDDNNWQFANGTVVDNEGKVITKGRI